MSDDNTLYIFTADKVGDTGECSWKFLFDTKPQPPRGEMDIICNLPFGWVAPTKRDERSHGFNVWRAGSGLVCGGGWEEGGAEEWQRKMLDAIPSCALLMNTDTFEWLKEHIFDKYGRPFKHYPSEVPLMTG
jgi:hypothetical protein